MNKAFIIGNLTRDPDARVTSGGTSVCSFTVAVSRTFSKNNETDFIPVVTWRGLADNCSRFLQKGQKVAVLGKIQTRSYDDSSGQKRYVTEIIADEVEFLSRPGNRPSGEVQPSADIQPAAEEVFDNEVSDFTPLDDEELPF